MLNLAEPFVQAYHDYQVDLAVEFGAELSRAQSEMLDALNFEIELANVKFQSCDLKTKVASIDFCKYNFFF